MLVATAAPSAPLRISAHVRACCSDGQVILLDLRRNQYLGVGPRQARALEGHVHGWPGGPEASLVVNAPSFLSNVTAPLLARELLTSAPSEPLPDCTLDEPTSSLDVEAQERASAVSVRRAWRFVQGAAVAAVQVRCRSLHAIAQGVAVRRERLREAARELDSRQAMLDVASAYEWLRPFVFTARHRCLHDSLALMDFMASEGLSPRWVIGVKTRPFGAHSWVQGGHIVLNDQHEHVRRFTPILVV